MERERGNERRNLKSILSWNEFCWLLWKSLLNWRLAISQYLNSNSNQYFNFKSNLVRSMPIIIAFRKFKRLQVFPQMRFFYSTATYVIEILLNVHNVQNIDSKYQVFAIPQKLHCKKLQLSKWDKRRWYNKHTSRHASCSCLFEKKKAQRAVIVLEKKLAQAHRAHLPHLQDTQQALLTLLETPREQRKLRFLGSHLFCIYWNIQRLHQIIAILPVSILKIGFSEMNDKNVKESSWCPISEAPISWAGTWQARRQSCKMHQICHLRRTQATHYKYHPIFYISIPELLQYTITISISWYPDARKPELSFGHQRVLFNENLE